MFVCVGYLLIIICNSLPLLPKIMKTYTYLVVAQSLLVSNYPVHTVSGYFNPAAAKQPLLHTWSLAVEEQFYSIFPLLFMAAFFFWQKDGQDRYHHPRHHIALPQAQSVELQPRLGELLFPADSRLGTPLRSLHGHSPRFTNP